MLLDPASVSVGAMYNYLISFVVPRPIAFVSTVNAAGRRNLAPFSFFNAISSEPPLVGVAILERKDDPKDTLRNIRETGEFVVNLVSESLLDAMVETSGDWPATTDEFEVSNLTAAPSVKVRPPRVASSPVAMECRLYREVPLGNAAFVVGEVLCAHLADDVLTDSRVDVTKLRPVARLGGEGYAIVREAVNRKRPKVARGG